MSKQSAASKHRNRIGTIVLLTASALLVFAVAAAYSYGAWLL